MKGKTLVIGLLLLIIISIVAVYFAMQVSINNIENGMAPVVNIIELLTEDEKI